WSFSICTDLLRISWEIEHHLDARKNGTFSVPLSPSVWPGRPCLAGACSPNLVHPRDGITTI
ncbi:MAG: hypothetical protein PHS80_09075, partial [Methanothrix sp.]|nr:hypothetical protein [Methanothrix sp.]